MKNQIVIILFIILICFPNYSAAVLISNNDGTITDTENNLMWLSGLTIGKGSAINANPTKDLFNTDPDNSIFKSIYYDLSYYTNSYDDWRIASRFMYEDLFDEIDIYGTTVFNENAATGLNTWTSWVNTYRLDVLYPNTALALQMNRERFYFLYNGVSLEYIVCRYIPSNPVPEPSTIILFSLGLFGFVGIYRKNKIVIK